MSTKGKLLRNKQKRLDKVFETEAKVKSGELKPSEQQQEMVDSKKQLLQEVKDLNKLIELYIQSNPDYEKKAVANVPSETLDELKTSAWKGALEMIARINIVQAMMREDSSLLEGSENQRANLDEATQFFEKMREATSHGSAAWTDQADAQNWVSHMMTH